MARLISRAQRKAIDRITVRRPTQAEIDRLQRLLSLPGKPLEAARYILPPLPPGQRRRWLRDQALTVMLHNAAVGDGSEQGPAWFRVTPETRKLARSIRRWSAVYRAARQRGDIDRAELALMHAVAVSTALRFVPDMRAKQRSEKGLLQFNRPTVSDEQVREALQGSRTKADAAAKLGITARQLQRREKAMEANNRTSGRRPMRGVKR